MIFVLLDEFIGQEILPNTDLSQFIQDIFNASTSLGLVVINIMDNLLYVNPVTKVWQPRFSLSQIFLVIIKVVAHFIGGAADLIKDLLSFPFDTIDLIIRDVANEQFELFGFTVVKDGSQFLFGFSVDAGKIPRIEDLNAVLENQFTWWVGINLRDASLDGGIYFRLYNVFGGDLLCAPFTNICLESPKVIQDDKIYLSTHFTIAGSEIIDALGFKIEAFVFSGIDYRLSIWGLIATYFSNLSESLGTWEEIIERLVKNEL